jgi:uncharacterized protein (TIGR02466 family)
MTNKGPISFEGVPEEKGMPLFPFAPMIYYYKLPMSLVRRLNKYTNKVIKDEKKSKKLDHSDNLVGKVKQEILIEPDELEKHMEILNQPIAQFLNTDLSRNFTALHEDTGFGINYNSAWIVRQFAGEYNPAHIHTSCDMSCVGYLKLPENIQEEWQQDYKDHYPANGHIEFVHGQPGRMSVHTIRVKPSVGDFFVFPSDLIHIVYPFTSDGERRSFSANLSITQEKKGKDGTRIPSESIPHSPLHGETYGHKLKDFNFKK